MATGSAEPSRLARMTGWASAWWGSLGRGERTLALVLLVFFLAVFYVALDANKYSATVRVIEGEGKVGVNPTTERLDFGDLSPGTSAVRRVDIQNKTPIPMFVAVVTLGRIADLMKTAVQVGNAYPSESQFFVLPARAGAKIEFTTYMPASATVNDVMDGRVIIFKIPGPWR